MAWHGNSKSICILPNNSVSQKKGYPLISSASAACLNINSLTPSEP